jgi:hypothetical protein
MKRIPSLRHVSDILRDITEADGLSVDATRAVRAAHPFSRHCSCADCMRAYLASVEGKGDAA